MSYFSFLHEVHRCRWRLDPNPGAAESTRPRYRANSPKAAQCIREGKWLTGCGYLRAIPLLLLIHITAFVDSKYLKRLPLLIHSYNTECYNTFKIYGCKCDVHGLFAQCSTNKTYEMEYSKDYTLKKQYLPGSYWIS